MGNRMITWPMTSRDPERLSRDSNTLRVQYREINLWCYLAKIANYQIVCCDLWGSTVGYPIDSLASCRSSDRAHFLYQHCKFCYAYFARDISMPCTFCNLLMLQNAVYTWVCICRSWFLCRSCWLTHHHNKLLQTQITVSPYTYNLRLC